MSFLRKISKKNHLFAWGGLGVAMVPLALAASCGSDGDSKEPNNPSTEVSTAEILAKWKIDPTSTHDQVVWPSFLQNATIADYAFYLPPSTKTAAEIAVIAPEAWQKALPASINYDASKRSIWVKITPAAGYTIASPFLDLTNSSNIQKVKSKVDVSANFETIDLATITLSVVSATEYEIAEVADIPPGAQILYDGAGASALTKAALQTHLASRTTSSAELALISAYLAPVDSAKYVVSNNKRSKIDVVTNVTKLENISNEDKALINTIKVDETTRHNAVLWTKPSTPFSSALQGIVYSTSSYADEAAASLAPASDWKSELPASLSFAHEQRHLWVRAVPARGFLIKNLFVDITTSSEVGSVKSLIDASEGFNAFSLASSVAINLTKALVYEAFEVSIPAGAVVNYQVSTEPLRSRADFNNWIKNDGQPTKELLATTKAQLVVSDATKFVLTDNKQTVVALGYAENVYADLAALASDFQTLTKITATSTSNHDEITWNNGAFTISNKLTSVMFLTGNYATLEAVKAAPTEAWTSALPTKTGPSISTRYLWVKLVPATDVVIENLFYDLTVSSGIRAIKILVDALPGFNLIDPAKVLLSGNRYGPTIDESVVFKPDYLSIKYAYKGMRNLSAANLKAELIKDAATMTLALAQTIKVYIAPLDLTFYTIKNNKEAVITTDGGGDLSKAFVPDRVIEVDIEPFLNNIKYVSGYHNALVWSAGFNSNQNVSLPEGVQALDFVVGNHPTQVEAEAAGANAKLPYLRSTVDIDYTKRFVWAFATPTPGFKLKNDLTVFNLTTSSNIAAALGYVLAADLNSSFLASSKLFIVRGTISAPEVSFAGQVVPTGIKASGFITRTKLFSGEHKDWGPFLTIGEALKSGMDNALLSTVEQLNNALSDDLLISVVFVVSDSAHYVLDPALNNGIKVALSISLT